MNWHEFDTTAAVREDGRKITLRVAPGHSIILDIPPEDADLVRNAANMPNLVRSFGSKKVA